MSDVGYHIFRHSIPVRLKQTAGREHRMLIIWNALDPRLLRRSLSTRTFRFLRSCVVSYNDSVKPSKVVTRYKAQMLIEERRGSRVSQVVSAVASIGDLRCKGRSRGLEALLITQSIIPPCTGCFTEMDGGKSFPRRSSRKPEEVQEPLKKLP